MNELGAELDWNWRLAIAVGEHPAADALARLEHDHGNAGLVQRACGGDSCCSCPDDDHVAHQSRNRQEPCRNRLSRAYGTLILTAWSVPSNSEFGCAGPPEPSGPAPRSKLAALQVPAYAVPWLSVRSATSSRK